MSEMGRTSALKYEATGRDIIPASRSTSSELPLAVAYRPHLKAGPRPMVHLGQASVVTSSAMSSTPGLPRPRRAPSGETALYRFFNSQGELLYVGITGRLKIRFKEHERDFATTWWPLVARHTVKWFPTRTEAGRAERKAIQTENPLYNVLLTPRNRGKLGVSKGGPVRKVGANRGEESARRAEEFFGGKPFTQDELRALVGQSPSAVHKNIAALVKRGRLSIVGTRRVAGTAARPHNLYVVTQAANLPIEQIREFVSMDPSRPKHPRNRARGTQGRDLEFLEQAKKAFGSEAFTRVQLAAAAGTHEYTTGKYIRSLERKGLLIKDGRGERKPGARGYPLTAYRVATTTAGGCAVSQPNCQGEAFEGAGGVLSQPEQSGDAFQVAGSAL